MNAEPYLAVLVEELIAARENAGLSQRELAERLGRNQSVLATWETGLFWPKMLGFLAWADALGFDVALIPREDEP